MLPSAAPRLLGSAAAHNDSSHTDPHADPSSSSSSSSSSSGHGSSARHSIFDFSNGIDPFLLGLCLLGLTLFTALAELVIERLEHISGSLWRAAIAKLFKELMLLGFLSFSLLIFLETVDVSTLPDGWLQAFELSHLLVFFMAVALLAHSLYFAFISRAAFRKWHKMETMHVVEVARRRLLRPEARRGTVRRLCCGRGSSLEYIHFHVLRSHFIACYGLNSDFSFSCYLQQSTVATITDLLDISSAAWACIAVLVALTLPAGPAVKLINTTDPSSSAGCTTASAVTVTAAAAATAAAHGHRHRLLSADPHAPSLSPGGCDAIAFPSPYLTVALGWVILFAEFGLLIATRVFTARLLNVAQGQVNGARSNRLRVISWRGRVAATKGPGLSAVLLEVPGRSSPSRSKTQDADSRRAQGAEAGAGAGTGAGLAGVSVRVGPGVGLSVGGRCSIANGAAIFQSPGSGRCKCSPRFALPLVMEIMMLLQALSLGLIILIGGKADFDLFPAAGAVAVLILDVLPQVLVLVLAVPRVLKNWSVLRAVCFPDQRVVKRVREQAGVIGRIRRLFWHRVARGAGIIVGQGGNPDCSALFETLCSGSAFVPEAKIAEMIPTVLTDKSLPDEMRRSMKNLPSRIVAHGVLGGVEEEAGMSYEEMCAAVSEASDEQSGGGPAVDDAAEASPDAQFEACFGGRTVVCSRCGFHVNAAALAAHVRSCKAVPRPWRHIQVDEEEEEEEDEEVEQQQQQQGEAEDEAVAEEGEKRDDDGRI